MIMGDCSAAEKSIGFWIPSVNAMIDLSSDYGFLWPQADIAKSPKFV